MANQEAFAAGLAIGKNKARSGGFGGRPKASPQPVRQITTSDNQVLTPSSSLKSYKKGGRVRRTGPAMLHKGERVLTRKEARTYAKKRGKKVARRKVGKE